MKLKTLAFALLLLTLVVSSFGQAVLAGCNETLKSKLMGREMPYIVILPPCYTAQADARFPVLFLLHGLTAHYDSWTASSKLIEHASAYSFIIVTPEGDNGWYTDSETVPADKYESYIIQELIPEIDSRFRTIANRENRAIAGLSMGGYGSIKFGLKYPEKFKIVGSFSGALMAPSYTTEELLMAPPEIIELAKVVADTLSSVFGAHNDSETRKANDIFRLVGEMTPGTSKMMPFFYVDCGTEDDLIYENIPFAALLFEKKLPHEYRQLPGSHDLAYWDSQVQEFLEVLQKYIM